MKFVLSLVDSLGLCRHLLYIFQDISSYHSNAVSEVAILIGLVTSNGWIAASFLVRFSKKMYSFR